jgi:hypothetical protein
LDRECDVRVGRRLRADAVVLELLLDYLVERIGLGKRRQVVDAGGDRRESALDRVAALIGRLDQALNRLEGEVRVLGEGRDAEVVAAG